MSTHPSDKTDARERILRTAEVLFAEHGFEAVGVRQIAQEADVNVAMVSYYFGSKEGLFTALIEHKMPHTGEHLADIARSADRSPWDKLCAAVDMYVDKITGSGGFHRILSREMSLRQRPEHVALITGYITRNMHIIRGFLEDGQASGLFREVDNALTISSIFGMISGYANNRPMIALLLGEDSDNLFSDAYRNRLKAHIKSMLKAHLMVASS